MRVLGLADLLQVKYEFVRVVGAVPNSERYYLATSALAVSSNLKLKQDLGEDHFSYTTYGSMALEEVITLKSQRKIPLLTEVLLGKVLLASVRREDCVKLIGHKGRQYGNNDTRRANKQRRNK
jgi:hypothetical protein